MGLNIIMLRQILVILMNEQLKKNMMLPGKRQEQLSGGVNTKVVPSFSDPSIIKTYMGNFVIHMFKDEVPEHKKYLIYAPQIIKDFGIKIKR